MHEAADPTLRRGGQEEAWRFCAEPFALGGFDLSAIADETTDAMEELAPDQRHEDAIDQSSVLVDVTVSTSPVALPTPQPDQKPVLEHEPAEKAGTEAPRPKAPRRRRGGVEALPRGERWKRRLPEVLRRRR